MAQWAALEMMEFVPPVAMCADQSRGGQQVEMLGDRLPRGGQAVFHGEPSAQLEQGLPVVVGQFVENCPPGRIGEGFEDRSVIGVHTSTIGKCLLAYQVRRSTRVFPCRPPAREGGSSRGHAAFGSGTPISAGSGGRAALLWSVGDLASGSWPEPATMGENPGCTEDDTGARVGDIRRVEPLHAHLPYGDIDHAVTVRIEFGVADMRVECPD